MHHRFDITLRELVAAIPMNAQKDNRGHVVPPFEGVFMLFQEYDSQRVIDEPVENNCSIAILATESEKGAR
jgi:hypothetical protein